MVWVVLGGGALVTLFSTMLDFVPAIEVTFWKTTSSLISESSLHPIDTKKKKKEKKNKKKLKIWKKNLYHELVPKILKWFL